MEALKCGTSKETYSDLSNRDVAYLKVALALAETSECRMRHGAVVVRGGSVIATGVNRHRNHPLVLSTLDDARTQASTHAEINALKHIDIYRPVTNGAVIYIARVNKQGKPMMSRPCNQCFISLMEYGIKEVVYTLSEA